MFNERIHELRLSLKLNQVEFGKRINVTKQSVCNWENNNIQPSIDMIVRIANAFSVSADYLLGISERSTIDVSGLNVEEITHLQELADDLKKKNRFNTDV